MYEKDIYLSQKNLKLKLENNEEYICISVRTLSGKIKVTQKKFTFASLEFYIIVLV